MRRLTILPVFSESDFAIIKYMIGEDVPPVLADFFKVYGGMSFKESDYVVSQSVKWRVQKVLRPDQIHSIIRDYKNNNWGAKIPFALEASGFHFSVSLEEETKGAVYILAWIDTSEENQFIKIADSLAGFIENLVEPPEEIL